MDKLSSIGQLEWLRNKILSRQAEDMIEVHVREQYRIDLIEEDAMRRDGLMPFEEPESVAEYRIGQNAHAVHFYQRRRVTHECDLSVVSSSIIGTWLPGPTGQDRRPNGLWACGAKR